MANLLIDCHKILWRTFIRPIMHRIIKMDKDTIVRHIIVKYLKENNNGTPEFQNIVDLLTKIWCLDETLSGDLIPILDLVPEPITGEEQLNFLIEEGNLSVGSGNYDQAIERYSEAISINPNVSDFYSRRAAANMKKTDYKLAILDLQKALELNPDDPVNYARLSFCYWCLNDQENSLNTFSIAAGNNVDDDILHNLQLTIRKYPYQKPPNTINEPSSV